MIFIKMSINKKLKVYKETMSFYIINNIII
uniref:Uncharacterized protein n=1 Tax=viral metagenome TaxID=1070528 RepID=A0A6C0DM10_9ZZZZ